MKKTILILSAILLPVVFTSCSTLKEIPEDKTAAQILQMGQNALSIASYNDAVFCYKTTIERFGSNPSIYVEAQYELANTYRKQRKYDKAYAIYTELLDAYDSNPGYLPPAYKKLCQIGINNIPANRLAEIKAAEESND